MKFYDYKTGRACMKAGFQLSKLSKYPKKTVNYMIAEAAHDRRMSNEDYRTFVIEQSKKHIARLDPEYDAATGLISRVGEGDERIRFLYEQEQTSSAEEEWVQSGRPFYNLWPVVTTMKVSLDIKLNELSFPFATMLMRHAEDSPEVEARTSLVSLTKTAEQSYFSVRTQTKYDTILSYEFVLQNDDENLESLWDRKEAGANWGGLDKGDYEILEKEIQLAVLVSLLYQDRETVTPVVLAADRDRFDTETDEAVREAILKRASKRIGPGWDVGRELQREKEVTPHWRRPHLSIYRVGPGRKETVYKWRRGSFVRTKVDEVPTGFLGPEAEGDSADTWIYFIEDTASGRVKIGRSNNPNARLQQLQTGSSGRLQLILTIRGSASRERELHQQFGQDRIQGEWFHHSEKIQEFISQYMDQE